MTDVTGSSPPSAASRSTAHEVKGVQTAERLLAEVRNEIGRADSKASVLIAAIGVCAGAVVSGQWEAALLVGAGRVFGGVGSLAWVAAVGFLLFATFPRYRSSRWRTGLPVTYFLDVRLAARTGMLADALRGAEDDQLAGLVTALGDASGIAAAKHRWIRMGLSCFALGAVALVLGVLVS
ncbi:Pycsar system effector family protein [Streptomyces sp. NPDC048644]|uniref:Pycsar system effector family protein n=1 Tax=Streptomyces sp. NPDC048644 TaxID=3365582 RepID=UPI003723696C